MDNQIIFKCFQTPKGCYLYDRYSNSVIRVNAEQYDELVKIEAGLAEPSSSHVINELQEKGICLPGEVEDILHPSTPFLSHLLQHRISDVILQVTQNCNLRCGYCVYGGNYKNRSHSPKTMDFGLAKKAIDFGMERSQESSNFVVSFYGGEPLLAFDLIKKCVAYAKENIQGKELHFNMTTNGTLFTTEIMDFLVENNFQLLISLDGDRESHDANRVFKSGKGSFDLIMQNVRNFKVRHPSYVAERVQFNTVINPKTNPSCFDEFFSVSAIFQDTHIMFNEVASSNVKEDSLVSFSENYRIKRKFEFLKLFMSMSGKLDESYVSRLVIDSKRSYYDLYKELRLHAAIANVMHPQGPCIPGIARLFVNVNGEFFPCERVPELAYACIGNISNGFDVERIEQIMNIGRLSEKECKSCWALRLCSSCLNDIECHDCTIDCQSKLSGCAVRKKVALSNLFDITALSENGFELPLEEE